MKWKDQSINILLQDHIKANLNSQLKFTMLILGTLTATTFYYLSTYTIISCLFLLYGIYKFIWQKMGSIKKNGLIHYFPTRLKHTLLNRSLLDILCDWWFAPGKMLDVVIRPWIDSSIAPKEVYKTLDQLDSRSKRVFTTKGLAFLFSKRMKKLFLGRAYFGNEEEEFEDLKEELNITKLICPTVATESSNIMVKSKKIEEGKKNNQDQLQTSFSFSIKKWFNMSSIDDNSTQAQDLTLPFTDSFSESPRRKRKGSIFIRPRKEATRLILSSEQVSRLHETNAPGRVDSKWDNMDSYIKIQKKLEKEGASGLDGNQKQVSPQEKFDIKMKILKLIIEMREGKLLRKISSKTLLLITGVSLLSVVTQLYLSRRTRRMTKQLLQRMITLIGVGGLGITGGLLALNSFTTPPPPPKQAHMKPKFLD